MKVKTKACAVCGKKFIPRSNSQKYCCEQCRRIGYAEIKEKYLSSDSKVRKERECIICENPFLPKNGRQVTCGKYECRKEYGRIKKLMARGTYSEERAKKRDVAKKKQKKEKTAEELWELMTWEEISAELARLHLKYGQAQVLKMQGRLPKDFGKGCKR